MSQVTALLAEVWYTEGMERRVFPNEVNVRSRHWFDEDLVSFSMSGIVVDGIPSSPMNNTGMVSHHSAAIITCKGIPDDYAENEEGYLTGSPAWDDPYWPVGVHQGEIDDEVWYYTDMLIGKRHPDYEYYKKISDEMKEARKHLNMF